MYFYAFCILTSKFVSKISSCIRKVGNILYIKLMKGKALRKHSLHEKTAASVLLKLIISGNE